VLLEEVIMAIDANHGLDLVTGEGFTKSIKAVIDNLTFCHQNVVMVPQGFSRLLKSISDIMTRGFNGNIYEVQYQA